MAIASRPTASTGRPGDTTPADRAAARAAALCRATPRIAAGRPPAPALAPATPAAAPPATPVRAAAPSPSAPTAAAAAVAATGAPMTARVRDLLDRRRRERLAARIAAVVAARRTADGSGACGRLRDAEHLLRSGLALPAPAAHALEAFLDRAEAGAYAGRDADLRRDAGAACAALGIVTPFA
ncbi:hypothetical protein [Patulibacter sp. SYSU D01012]|uniref:hypothetical protein n=1 Tax=Patulibacter sp. SYSU D01012 TaxID=2817381 RepID=UPI001B3156FE|nr:hypothetical protein [Patulibacter sp. SYSU D01012]